jgi:hypothetical protein
MFVFGGEILISILEIEVAVHVKVGEAACLEDL